MGDTGRRVVGAAGLDDHTACLYAAISIPVVPEGGNSMLRFIMKLLPWVLLGGAGLPLHAQDADPTLVARARALSTPRSDATFVRQCTVQPARFPGLGEGVAATPARLFDNLYYVGKTDVGAWVIETSDGLALIDTLNNVEEAEQIIIPGMRSLGLDPDQLKVVLVTHFHGDHAGGATYFRDRGVRIMLSETDWQPLGGAPDADSIARDGETLMLGDTPITFVLTPGHTPGAISMIFPVFENGQRHTAVVMELTPRGGVDVHEEAVAGMQHLGEFTASNNVDVALHPHEMIFDPEARDFIMSASTRAAGSPNALVIGNPAVQQYVEMVSLCWQARIATMQATEGQ
jgi:metallo-beta-lactamase class B